MILSHDGHGNPASLAAKPADVTIKHSIYYKGVNGSGASFEESPMPLDRSPTWRRSTWEDAGARTLPKVNPWLSNRAR